MIGRPLRGLPITPTGREDKGEVEETRARKASPLPEEIPQIGGFGQEVFFAHGLDMASCVGV